MPCIYTLMDRTLEGLSPWCIWNLHPPWVSFSSGSLYNKFAFTEDHAHQGSETVCLPRSTGLPWSWRKEATLPPNDQRVYDVRQISIAQKQEWWAAERGSCHRTVTHCAMCVCLSIYLWISLFSWAFLCILKRDDVTYPRLYAGEKMRHNLSTASSTKDLLPFASSEDACLCVGKHMCVYINIHVCVRHERCGTLKILLRSLVQE